MVQSKMTVRSALNTHQGIRDAVVGIKAIQSAIEHSPELHDRVQAAAGEFLPGKKPKDPTYLLNHAANLLAEYGDLLKTAIDRTEMDWPPAAQ